MSSSTTDPAIAAGLALVDVTMPAIGTSIVEATVVEWRVAVGEEVAADAVVCDISSDKVDTEVPSPCSGTLAELLVEPGETVEVGTVLARIATAHAPAPAAPAPGVPAPAVPAAPAEDRTIGAPAEPRSPAAASADGAARRYSPVVTRIAATHGIDLAAVAGSGRDGRVTKKDVLAHVNGGGRAPAPAPAEPEERPLHSESPYRPDPAPAPPPLASDGGAPRELSRMRRSIGAAMRNSLSVAATCTTIVECDMTQVERRRRELGLTALPLVARATIETLREFPDLNATLDGDTLTTYDAVHLGIAVSLGDDGLIVPVIRDAHELAPEGLGSRVKDLATRARERRLQPDEVRGGTFTITNPGAYGALIATPVIAVPQVAILDLEAIVRRPVVVTDEDGNESIAIRPMVNLCMSWDHRAMDGVYAARFLTALRRRLEAR